MQEIIRDIRSQLRRAMNGIVSASMREKGVNYRLNFGVSLAKIREMAARYDKNVELARTLWKEDVREMKILATLLYPVEAFSKEEAEEWTSEIHHLEIAELYTLHMLRFVPFVQELAAAWVVRRDGFFPVTGFLLYARLCSQGDLLLPDHTEVLFREAKTCLDNGISHLQRAALLALKRYGRQSALHAENVLELVADYVHSDLPERVEFYEDLKFEFEYYL